MYEHDVEDVSTNDGGDYIEVSSGGDDFHLDADYDSDHDGVNDSAVVASDDGSTTTYTDTDGDGDADYRVTVDADGDVVDAERHDEGSDRWVDAGAGNHEQHPTDDDTNTVRSNEHISVDTGDGEVDAGEARYDVDGDGVNDTAVVTDGEGNSTYVTDFDGDGDADAAATVDEDGNVVVYTESGDDGDWEVAEAGHLDSSGNYEQDYQAKS